MKMLELFFDFMDLLVQSSVFLVETHVLWFLLCTNNSPVTKYTVDFILCFRFVDWYDYQYIEMDTDSVYMALSGPLEQLMGPDMKETYYTEYGNWYP